MPDAFADSYNEFLATKFRFTKNTGFDVDESALSSILKPHQRDLVRWAIKGGNRAIFAAFGLGKTFMQVEIERHIQPHSGGPALVVCPLGCRQEFMKTAPALGVNYSFIRSSTEMTAAQEFYVTNYESIRDGKLDPNLFSVVSLDEASVLRSYGSKTYQEFLPLFSDVPYKFVATATPSPNRYKELIHYAGFLGIMDTGQALTRFFQRDSTQANNLTLYPHMEKEFYTWLHSWAIFLQKPSDLGYSDEGYDLPPLDVRYHEVKMHNLGGKVDRDGQIQLINDAAIGLKDAASEKRDSIDLRVATAKQIVDAAPDEHFILWHDLESERDAIRDTIDSVEVYGSQDLDEREQAIIDFGNGLFRILSTKPRIAGSGCNFQRQYRGLPSRLRHRLQVAAAGGPSMRERGERR